jgi:hypothetical protein
MRRPIVLIIGAIAALTLGLGGGEAFAYFTSSGSGSGGTTTGSPSPVTVVAATGTPSSDLVPGGTADLTLTLNNPNTQTLNIVGISQAGPVTVVGGTGCTSDSGSEPSLTLGNSGVAVPTQSGISGVTVGSGSAQIVHIPKGVSMASTSYSGCQKASFQIPVNITVHEG